MKSKLIPKKPFLLMFYGYPGCGKTFFSRQFAAETQNTIHLQADKIANETRNFTNNNMELTNKLIAYLVENYLENGISVIMDAALQKSIERKSLKKIALKKKVTPLLIWMQTDIESAYRRTKLRSKKGNDDFADNYSKEDFARIANEMQNPKDEDFLVISGKHTYKSQRATAVSKLAALNIISKEQANKNLAKPELVNLVPRSLGGRSEFGRNISIR